MSYPEPKYLAESGEISAVLRGTGEPANINYPSGGTCDYLATGATTDGQFGLYRWNMVPGQGGPEPHFHRTMTESFFIISGSVQLYNGEKWLDTAPGDFLYVPEGGVHGFRNATDEAASMLILFTPGGPREGYFEGLAEWATSGKQPTPKEYKEFCLKHDNIFLSFLTE